MVLGKLSGTTHRNVGARLDRWDGTEARADEFFYRSHIAEGGQLPLLGDLP